MTLAIKARVQYANINREINQSEPGSSLTEVYFGLTQQIREVKLNPI